MKLHEYTQTDSTNEEARRYAAAGGEVPALFIAEEQSAGRGRMGRSFFSPSRTGLYTSLLIKAPADTSRMLSLTAIAAVAATDAIKERFGIELDIKWVNDLYLESKKVSGVLAESFVFEGERFVVIGIGINLCTEQFPDELLKKAGSLAPSLHLDRDQKRELAIDIAQKMITLIDSASLVSTMQKYRLRSCVIGKRITFTIDGKQLQATALDINDNGSLSVELGDGTRMELSSGEISIFFD